MADDMAPERARPKIDGRAPEASAIRADEALEHSVLFGGRDRECAALLNRESQVAVSAGDKALSKPDRERCEIFEMRPPRAFLQSRVDDQIQAAKNQQVQEPQRRHRDRIHARQRRSHLKSGSAARDDLVDGGAISKRAS